MANYVYEADTVQMTVNVVGDYYESSFRKILQPLCVLNVTFFKFLHPKNALCPIFVTSEFIVTSVIE